MVIRGQEGLEGLEGREGKNAPAGPAHPASRALPALVWSIALLVIFFTVVRTLGERMRPVEAAIDCRHVAVHDVPALERCLDLRPDDVELMADLGAEYEQARQWDRAESVYRRAIAIDAEDGDTRVRLGDLLMRRGDISGARREAVAALAVQPGRAPALDLLRRADAATSAARDR